MKAPDTHPVVWTTILAAGNSERMMSPKALLPFWQECTFLEKILAAYAEAGIAHVAIVVRDRWANVFQRLLHHSKCPLPADVRMVVNPRPADGRFSSIRTGLATVEAGAGAFVQNIDNPFTGTDLVRKMMAALEDGKYAVPVVGGKHGHPVLLSAAIVDRIRGIEGNEENLKRLLTEYEAVDVPIEDPHVLANINTEDDYSRWFSDEDIH